MLQGLRSISKERVCTQETAKGRMVNAVLLASKLIEALPENEIPERTEGREGFFHVMNIKGDVENVYINLIIRDHDRNKFNARKELLSTIVKRFPTEAQRCCL